MRLVGEFGGPRRPDPGVKAHLRVVGGRGGWMSLSDFAARVRDNLPLAGTSRGRNLILADLWAVRTKFGGDAANGLIDQFGLEEHGFEPFD